MTPLKDALFQHLLNGVISYNFGNDFTKNKKIDEVANGFCYTKRG